MHRLRAHRPTPTSLVAFLALVLALGGTAWAAVSLPANSVSAKQLKKNAVERGKIKNNAVDGSKIADGSVKGADVDESSLTGVKAASLEQIVYKTVRIEAPAVPANVNTTSATATSNCNPGTFVVGGGVTLDSDNDTIVNDSGPVGNNAFTATILNFDRAGGHGGTLTAICIAAAATG
jgi:hypothetical protein